MDFIEFVRIPFTVQAVQVTADNIGEIATLCGELKVDNGTPYIEVERFKIPNLSRIDIGFWVTKMGKNIRAYSERVFGEQFALNTPEINAWVDFMNGRPVPANSGG